MRKFITVLAVMVSLLAMTATAQVRGKGRLQGLVVEQGSGTPVAGATVTISPADGATVPIVVTTNGKGRWSALGLTSGAWNIDIESKGYQVSRGTANVSEMQMLPAIRTELAKVVEETKPEVAATGVPQEIVDAVNLGQELMAAEKYKEAIVEFEKALPALPDNMSLKQVTAQAYYKVGDLKKAIEMLEVVTAAPDANPAIVVLLTNLYLENGQLDEAKARLAVLPADAVTDPTVYVNIGILFLNKNNPTEAVTYLGKAVDLDMTRADSLYYRGLAHLQLKNTKDAKADFEKVLSLAPDSPEGRDAKQLIDSMK